MIFAVIGFAVGAMDINWTGRPVSKAEVSFDELVGRLGLGYIQQVVGVIGIQAPFSSALTCILSPIMIIAAGATIVAWFIATMESLDWEQVQTIVTIILGWLALFVITALAEIILGKQGFGAAAPGSIFGQNLSFGYCVTRLI